MREINVGYTYACVQGNLQSASINVGVLKGKQKLIKITLILNIIFPIINWSVSLVKSNQIVRFRLVFCSGKVIIKKGSCVTLY